MILFLVVSDWANPSTTKIETTDGRQLNVSVLIRTAEMYRVQLQEPLGDHPKDAKLMLPIDEIVSETDVTPDNYRWVAWVFHHRWYFAAALLLATLVMVGLWFDRDEINAWMAETWSFSRSIIPLLFGGVLATGVIGALIPDEVVASWVGGNSLRANLIASVIGGMWYFATLTEVPILEVDSRQRAANARATRRPVRGQAGVPRSRSRAPAFAPDDDDIPLPNG